MPNHDINTGPEQLDTATTARYTQTMETNESGNKEDHNLRTEALLDIISKGLWVQKEPEILGYWSEDHEELRADYRRKAVELMEREGLLTTGRTYTLKDLARVWREGWWVGLRDEQTAVDEAPETPNPYEEEEA